LPGRWTCALALALALTLWSLAAAPAGSDASRGQWRAVSRQLASPWPKIQRRDGSLPDALRGGASARYGNGMAGLGLLQTGVREHNRRLVWAGLRAVNVQTRRIRDPAGAQEFRTWAVAEAYSLARTRLSHLHSARAATRRWAGWLRHARIFWLRQPDYQNKTLVDAVAFLQLVRTGLHSKVKGSALGDGRREAGRLVVRLVNSRIPAVVRRRGFLLSDPGPHPLAYHALSYAMYARAVGLLGPRASPRAHAVLRKLAWTTDQVTAPTGDVAYWGRSQAMGWTLSSSAYGLAATVRERGVSGAARRRYLALADRLLTRLRGYGSGPRGEWIVPALRQDRSARAAIDHYAHAPEYTGLALVYLNWAISLLPRHSTAGEIAADRPLRAVIGQGRARYAVVRQGNLWYAVRERGTGGLRYDFGVIAAKRLEGGRWHDIVPLRPPLFGSTGPVLRLGRRHGLPVGTSIRVTGRGRVLIGGGFRYRRRWLRRHVQFSFEPSSCGPLLRLGTRAGDRYNFTAFFRPGARKRGPNYRLIGDQVASFTEPLTSVRFKRSRPSPSDAHLIRGRFSLKTPKAGSLGVVLC
jgi:hypothetical protein